MLRTVLTAYLLLATGVGPGLCCCSFKQFAAFATGSKDWFGCCGSHGKVAVAHHDHKHSHGHSHQHGKHEASHSHHAHQESGENGSRQSPRPAKESCPCKQHGNTALVAVGEWTTSQQLTLSSQFELSLDNIVAVTISLANISFGPNSLATQGQAFPHMSCRDILRAIQTLRC